MAAFLHVFSNSNLVLGQIPLGLKPPSQNHKSPISEHDLTAGEAVSGEASVTGQSSVSGWASGLKLESE
jgi:hypothetical protein